jgi:DNA (cytosine-5)-methyltransferase 1
MSSSQARPVYRDRLNELWSAATAPRDDDAPTVVSTFAGMGGSTTGYLAAGFREVLAVEQQPHAAACLALNFGCDIHADDITSLDPAKLPLAPGELDVLDGSPPCQGFSSSGLRRKDDPRNRLWCQFARLAEAWKPKALVMENVPLIASSPVFAMVRAELDRIGYRTRAAILPAALFGAATDRKRFILVGIRDDIGRDPTHPKPDHRPVTVREAFAALPGDTIPAPEMPARFAGLARMIEPGRCGGKALSARGGRESYWSVKRLSWDKPSNAIPSTFRKHTSGFIHPDETRYLTIAELMRIQSVPDGYRWPEGTTYKDAHNRIGNSVPPLLMHAVAAHVRGLLTGGA